WYGYGVSDRLDTAYQTSSIRCIGFIRYDVLTLWVRCIGSLGTAYWLFGYGVLESLGTAYWLFGYGELAENVLLMIFDQSIIYGVSADMDTAYSSKSGNGLEFFKAIRYGV
ncbi:hypothetical protein Tco_0919245, partial [Tanacetum coccineum]